MRDEAGARRRGVGNPEVDGDGRGFMYGGEDVFGACLQREGVAGAGRRVGDGSAEFRGDGAVIVARQHADDLFVAAQQRVEFRTPAQQPF